MTVLPSPRTRGCTANAIGDVSCQVMKWRANLSLCLLEVKGEVAQARLDGGRGQTEPEVLQPVCHSCGIVIEKEFILFI